MGSGRRELPRSRGPGRFDVSGSPGDASGTTVRLVRPTFSRSAFSNSAGSSKPPGRGPTPRLGQPEENRTGSTTPSRKILVGSWPDRELRSGETLARRARGRQGVAGSQYRPITLVGGSAAVREGLSCKDAHA